MKMTRSFTTCMQTGLVILACFFGLAVPLTQAASVTLAWDAPAAYTDGTPIGAIGGYKLHYGLASRSYSTHLAAGTNMTATADGLAEGQTYYFAVTAVSTGGVESAHSEEIVWQAPDTAKTLTVRSSGVWGAEAQASPVDREGQTGGVAPYTLVYDHGTEVTLVAASEANGEPFAGWTGVDSSDGVTATLILDRNRNATAEYGDNQDPYGDGPHRIPGTVEVEDFDEGTDGYAYHDTTAENEGSSAYRTGHGVDINERSTAGNGQCIIAARTGEWLEYTVNIATTGFYTVGARVAMSGVGGVFHIEAGETDVTGPLQVPDTGGWYTWRDVTRPDVALSAGQHTIRLAMDSANSAGSVGIFDSLIFTYQPPPGPKTVEVLSRSMEDVVIAVTPTDQSGLSDGTAPFARTYEHDTTVTLTAPAEAGGEPFTGWSGVDAAAGTTATVLLDADKTVTAKYGEDQDPFGGAPCSLPGTIQVEDFDEGANGEAYYDTTADNEGGAYRLNDSVDIKARSTAQNKYCVLAVRAGEWLEYTVNVTTTSLYTVGTRLAMRGTGGSFHLEVDGLDVTGDIQVPNTGGWYTWQTIEERDILLLAGRHVIRLAFDAAGDGGSVGVFDSLQFSAQSFMDVSSESLTVQVEDFDEGGEGVGYHDTTVANEGRKYRTQEAVDIYKKVSAQNDHCVAGARAGEWLAYTIDVPEAGRFALTVRLGMKGDGGTFHLESEGTDISGPMQVPDTGNWFNWRNIENTNIVLNAGRQVLRLVMDSNGPGGTVGVFDSFSLVFLEPLIQERPGEPPVNPATGSYIPSDILVNSSEAPYTNAWDMVDGDAETKWAGAVDAGGWWTAFVYEQDVPVSEVEVAWDEGSCTNLIALASLDAEDWFDLQEALDATTNAVPVSYLWLIMPDDGTGTGPVINEIFVR